MVSARKNILLALEKKLACPVAAIVYHDDFEIMQSDETHVAGFFDEFNSDKVAIILHGMGGHPLSGLGMAMTLRKKFDKMSSLVYDKAASAMNYLWLISNEAYFCSDRIMTQMDFKFNAGSGLRPSREYLNDPNEQARTSAQIFMQKEPEILASILSLPYSLLGGQLSNDPADVERFLSEVFGINGQGEHNSPFTIPELRGFGLNVGKPDETVSLLLGRYMTSANIGLCKNGNRALLETIDNYIELPQDGEPSAE